jgi:hypothetical protein
MIVIVAVRPNNYDNFLSHQWNYAHLDYVKQGAYPIPTILELDYPFFRRIFKFYQNRSSCFLHQQPSIGAKHRYTADKKTKIHDVRQGQAAGQLRPIEGWAVTTFTEFSPTRLYRTPGF